MKSKFRGNEIIEIEGEWYYAATGAKVADAQLPCARCKRGRTQEGHDACLGELEGLMNACCGHGNDQEAYVQFMDATSVHGQDALSIIRTLQESKND